MLGINESVQAFTSALCLQSSFLELVVLKEQQSMQLLAAKEAVAEAKGDSTELERLLAYLTGAHAQESAMHRVFKREVICCL